MQSLPHLLRTRRRFLKTAAGLPLLGMASLPLAADTRPRQPDARQRQQVRGLLLSATTVPGGTSMGHAIDDLRKHFEGRKDLLLINFASLPADRDAYEQRMQREFAAIHPDFKIRSLHRVDPRDAVTAIREAEGFFVSGGNTFLLLRELYDRFAVEVLRQRVLQGIPYAGSSAGANLAGITIGTTNDFPITDIPTRRALGILPAVFNPHHPDPKQDEAGFNSRQWKIGEHARFNRDQIVLGVTDPGLIRITGDQVTLAGKAGSAFVSFRDRRESVFPDGDRDISKAFQRVRRQSMDG